jgi:hypothetical protein
MSEEHFTSKRHSVIGWDVLAALMLTMLADFAHRLLNSCL